MLLELTVMSYHRLSPRQVAVKRFDITGGSIGRSEQADWYLPDPERVVSGVHALINYSNGVFTITDKSTNGLFVNRAVEALGAGNKHVLQHGDVLGLGDYDIQVALLNDAEISASSPVKTQQPQSISSDNTALGKDDFIVKHQSVNTSAAGLSVADISADAFSGTQEPPSQFNTSHSEPALTMDDHFLAPSALIPDDWVSDWQTSDELPLPSQPLAATNAENKASKVSSLPTQEHCLQAFLSGLGVSEDDLRFAQSTQWWEALGKALQQSLHGLITVMRERSSVKNSFRVNQTTFQQRENNPLKFSATTEEAFHNLFNRSGASFMPAQQAIAEAFSDISQHEAAMLAGATGALEGLLAQLSPSRIEAADLGGSFVDKVNPAQRQARLWSRYKAMHNELASEITKKEKQGINDDFISAYEACLNNRQSKKSSG